MVLLLSFLLLFLHVLYDDNNNTVTTSCVLIFFYLTLTLTVTTYVLIHLWYLYHIKLSLKLVFQSIESSNMNAVCESRADLCDFITVTTVSAPNPCAPAR